MSAVETVPLSFERLDPSQMRARVEALASSMRRRRSVRHFSEEPIDLDVVRRCVEIASTAPSGANKQPWRFVLVTNPDVKRKIREAAEEEERAFYGGRAPARWLKDLEALGTTADKPFLEEAPALVVLFAQKHGTTEDEKHYYVNESVGIAAGFFILALHQAGLATLTHTPSPMGFLGTILGRPANERPYLLLPVGYPAPACEVPAIDKKPLEEVLVEIG